MIRKLKYGGYTMIKYHTVQRKVLLSLFEKDNQRSYSVQDILDAIPEEGISKSAVYRNLKAMEEEGLICKVNDPKQAEAQYHYLNPNGCKGVIHFKCESCDKIYHLNPHISNMIYTYAKDDLGFSLNKSGAFLHGKCENCSQIIND